MSSSRILTKLMAPVFAIALVVTVVGTAQADSTAPTVTLSEAVTLTAKVVGIDRADRTVILMGPRGNVVEVEAGEEVRNFDQVEVGDDVTITFYESVALYVDAPGSQPEVAAAEVMGRAEKGEKPKGVVLGAIDVSAVIRGIYKYKRELTLQMPDGHMVTTKVDPAIPGFEQLKVGDTVHARVTRALAISVETP